MSYDGWLTEPPPMESADDDEDCHECGGKGWIVDDCFEDTCCCADPEIEHGLIPCPLCNQEGK